MCCDCGVDVLGGEHLCCRLCVRRYCVQSGGKGGAETSCFRVEGFPNRLGDSALRARKGDCLRPDFVCEVCNFVGVFGREPCTPNDYYLCYLDRLVSIDEFHKTESVLANLRNVRMVARWGQDYQVPVMIAETEEELQGMPVDHRQLSWYFADKSRSVCFQTVKRMRSSLWNYYVRMPGLDEDSVPTSTPAFAHRFQGLHQRLGSDSKQAKVFSTRLLDDMITLFESDFDRSRGEKRLELCLANLAFHLYFTCGMRANEAFSETVLRIKDSVVSGAAAVVMGVRPHFDVAASIQTKEERIKRTLCLCSFSTAFPCLLRPGKWLVRALAALDVVGRGPLADDETLLLFADAQNVPWTMSWFWGTHVHTRLEQLQREGLGGLKGTDDLSVYGSNSPRRTWNTMAGKHPNPISVPARNRQARWRLGQRKKDWGGGDGMAGLYFEPDLEELLRATYYLSPLGVFR